MNKVGFLITDKKNEKRIGIIPSQLKNIKNTQNLFFEKNYGLNLGISDQEYIEMGANVVERDYIINECEILCDPKIGDSDYVYDLPDDKILFGYFHAVQNKRLTDKLIDMKSTCIAWEDMNHLGKHLFWKNNVLAGEAAVLHSVNYYGKTFSNKKVAVIGRGNTAQGAIKTFSQLGADVTVFSRGNEELFRKQLPIFDVVCNCVLWDTSRSDHIVYRHDLKRMKQNSMIIDVSCDRNGGIETSIPKPISDPVYVVDDIIHYTVDHTPSIYFYDASVFFGEVIEQYIDILVEGEYMLNSDLDNAIIINKGLIKDTRINEFQLRK